MTDRLARLERLARQERDLAARRLSGAKADTDAACQARDAAELERSAVGSPGTGMHRLGALRAMSEARAAAGHRIERAAAHEMAARRLEDEARAEFQGRQQALRQWERLGAQRRELAARNRRRVAQREADARPAPEPPR